MNGYGDRYRQPSVRQRPSQHGSPERSRQGASRSRSASRDGERATSSAQWRRRQDRADAGRSDDRRQKERRGMNGDQAVAPSRGMLQMEDILKSIQRDWAFMSTEDCVPAQVALQLMDSSSLGRARQYEDFKHLNKQLHKTFRTIVNEHHQGFNSAVGTYHKIQNAIRASQTKVRTLRASLVLAKDDLAESSSELQNLASSSQRYDEMLQLIGQIEHLQSLPDSLEVCISEKRFLKAVEILQEGLRMINRSDMHAIAALSDLRAYLRSQEATLIEILIEELHNHLYLKSPFCADRWKDEVQSQADKPQPKPESVAIPPTPRRTMQAFISSVDMSRPMVEDASRSPEADTFYYIRLLTEALGDLGVLDVAVREIEQRMPLELYRIVDKTSQEVDRRHPSSVRGKIKVSLNRAQLLPAEEAARAVVMEDLLGSLYAKLQAVAEAHRVLHDVLSALTRRGKLRYADNLTGGFRELWKLYQSEIRTILHDYLAADAGVSSSARNSTTAPGSSLTQRNERDRAKRVFRLNDMDLRSPAIAAELDDLDVILKNSVPGLLSASRRQPGAAVNEQPMISSDGAANGGKLLIEPSIFNMSLLLPPSLSFLLQLKEIIPPDSDITINMLTSFLDDFLTNVFQPQLEETLADLSSRIIHDPSAFQLDPRWTAVARRPIFRGASAIFSLISSFCKLLDALPPDQVFSQLIISTLVAFYDRCFAIYRSLTSDVPSSLAQAPTPTVRLAAALIVDDDEARTILEELLKSDGANAVAIDQEVQMMLRLTDERPLSDGDLFGSGKPAESLCLLYNSVTWLADQTATLRLIVSSGPTPDAAGSVTLMSDAPAREPLSAGLSPCHNLQPSSAPDRPPLPHWTDALPTSRSQQTIRSQNRKSATVSTLTAPYLPLNPSTAIALDTLTDSLRALATTILFTLHADIRLLTIHHLTLSLSSGNYHLDSNTDVAEAAPQIKALTTSYVALRRTYIQNLPGRPRAFIMTQLAPLICEVLVKRAGLIKIMNSKGAQRMGLNLLVLQQNLNNTSVNSLLSAKSNRALAQPGATSLPSAAAGGLSHDEDTTALLNSAAASHANGIAGTDLTRAKGYYDLFGEGGTRAAGRVIKNAGKSAKELGIGYEEIKGMVELCFSEGVSGMAMPSTPDSGGRGSGGGRESSLIARRGLNEALLRLSEEMWDA